jgi:predicted dehydrogenase
MHLRVGLVGCGHIAGAHAAAWQKTGLSEVAAVFDLNRDSARRFAARFKIPKVYDSLEALVNEVDVVDDCSPPKVHISVAMEALGRGRHYLVEKPAVMSSDELRQVLEAQRSSGAEICVVHNHKYNPGVKTAWKWVQEGRIGSPISLEYWYLTSVSTDRMMRIPNHWSHQLPGGRWIEPMPHQLYITHQFLGALEVANVSSLRLPDSQHPHTAEEMVVSLRGDDAVATFRYSARCESNLRCFTLCGREGTIRVNLLSGSAVLFRPHTHRWVRGVGLETLHALTMLARMIPDRISDLRSEAAHTALIRDFARHLRGLGPSPVPLDEIRYVVQTTEEIGRREAWAAAEIA